MPRELTAKEIADIRNAYYESIHLDVDSFEDLPDELEVLKLISKATMEAE